MFARSILSATLALVLCSAAAAGPTQQNNTTALWFENWIGLENAMLRVASPEREITDVFAKTGTPVFQLSGAVVDGVYRYELRASTDEMVKNYNYTGSALEGDDEEYVPKPFYKTGHFVVKGGVILNPSEFVEEEPEQ